MRPRVILSAPNVRIVVGRSRSYFTAEVNSDTDAMGRPIWQTHPLLGVPDTGAKFRRFLDQVGTALLRREKRLRSRRRKGGAS